MNSFWLFYNCRQLECVHKSDEKLAFKADEAGLNIGKAMISSSEIILICSLTHFQWPKYSDKFPMYAFINILIPFISCKKSSWHQGSAQIDGPLWAAMVSYEKCISRSLPDTENITVSNFDGRSVIALILKLWGPRNLPCKASIISKANIIHGSLKPMHILSPIKFVLRMIESTIA